MAGTIVDFFGYLSTDKTDAAKLASARRQCPFLGKQCTKPVAEDDAGGISGACAVAQIKDATPTICCPIRLYADDYKMLKIIAYKSFGVDLNFILVRISSLSTKRKKKVVQSPYMDTTGAVN